MTKITRQSRLRPSGIALLLVISAVAVASILGLAILSSAAMRVQTNATSCRASEAQYLAESGANLAMYYMQNPADAPSLTNGVYPGQTGLDFATSISGTVDVNVAQSDSDNTIYNIQSTARVGYQTDDRLARTLNVAARINSIYKVTDALTAASDFTQPSTMTISGDVRCDGIFTQAAVGGGASSTLNGNVFASGSNVTGWHAVPSFPTTAAPTFSQLNIVTTVSGSIQYYSYLDAAGVQRAGTPQQISGTISGSLTAATNNPKAVYYATSDITLGQCSIDGSIILAAPNLKLIVGDVAHITARPGMPALIASESIYFRSDPTTKSLTVDGVCWVGNSITSTASTTSNSSMFVNGALLLGGSTPLIGDHVGAVSVTFDATKASVPLLSDVNRTPQSISIVQWGI